MFNEESMCVRALVRPLCAVVAATMLVLASFACDGTQGVQAQTADSASGGDLIRNGGFEQGGSPAPAGWMRDMGKTGSKGSVSTDRSRRHSGDSSLRLQPNSRNGGDQPLAIAQVIPAAAFRGKQIEVTAFTAAEGGTSAILGILTIASGQASNLVMLPQAPSSPFEWNEQRTTYPVADDPSVQIVVTCFADGKSGSAWFDDVTASVAGTSSAAERSESSPRQRERAVRQAPPSGAPMRATINVDAGSIVRQIPRTLYGTNIEWRWNANGLWQEAQDRPDPDIVRLTRDLGVSLIRYPGGVYSDFFHWRQAIGPRQQRAPMLHEAGSQDKSRPNFGTDEALAFAQQVGAELLITVNAGTGTAQEAADWVRYVNGKGLRVRYWEVGNEIYINGNTPISRATSVNPETYANRFLEFAKAMREADPRIKIGAVGGENEGRYNIVSYPNWNRTVLQRAGNEIDFLSVHNSYFPVALESNKDLRTVYRAMFASPVLIERNLRTLARQLKQYVPGRDIDIAVTEWGPWFHIDLRSSPYIDHTKTLGSALFTASALKKFIESPETQIAAFWMLNDFGTLGIIGSRSAKFPPEPVWQPQARYYAVQMYTKHFGTQLVRSTTNGPTFNSETVGYAEAVKDAPYLDVVASLSGDRDQLFIIAVNKSFDDAIDANVSLNGFAPASSGTAWTLNGTGIDANTGTKVIEIPGLRVATQKEDPVQHRFSKGAPNEITLASSTVSNVGPSFSYRFPAHSVTSIVLTRK